MRIRVAGLRFSYQCSVHPHARIEIERTQDSERDPDCRRLLNGPYRFGQLERLAASWLDIFSRPRLGISDRCLRRIGGSIIVLLDLPRGCGRQNDDVVRQIAPKLAEGWCVQRVNLPQPEKAARCRP